MNFGIVPPTMRRVAEINNLLRQLSEHSKLSSKKKINKILAQKNFHFLTVKDTSISEKDAPIIGMACVYFQDTLSGFKGYIDDVVVDESYRGQGLGARLVQCLINLAKQKKAKQIDLTSAPKRKAANALYRKLGFKLRKTNIYRLILK